MNSNIDNSTILEELSKRHSMEVDAFNTKLKIEKPNLKKAELVQLIKAIVEYPLKKDSNNNNEKLTTLIDLGVQAKQSIIHLAIESLNYQEQEEGNGE